MRYAGVTMSSLRLVRKANTSPLSDDTLLTAHQQADPVVDAPVQEVLEPRGNGSPVGRVAYNHLLDIADKLLQSPELALITSSTVSQQLGKRLYRSKKSPVFACHHALYVDPSKRSGRVYSGT